MSEYIFVSSWTKERTLPEGFGVRQYKFDSQTGRLTQMGVINSTERLGVLEMDCARNILYALEETADHPDMRCGGGGRIFAFRIDPETGESQQISCVPTYSTNPSNLALDPTGNFLIVAHHATHSYITKIGKDENGKYCPIVEYDDSLVELFSVKEDGTIGELLDVAKHEGSGPKEKQKNPHPHSVTRSPSGNLFAVCDKGNDGVYMYRIDRERNKLITCGPPHMTPAGTMPRYCVFHPKQPFFYYNCEGGGEVFAARYDEDGTLQHLGTFGCLLPEYDVSGDRRFEHQGLCIHPSGKYLYNIVHGLELVAVYEINQNDGSLTLLQNQPVGYKWTRGATLSPDGRFLLTMSCQGDKIVVFQVDDDGKLVSTGLEYDHTAAADAVFWDPSTKGGH